MTSEEEKRVALLDAAEAAMVAAEAACAEAGVLPLLSAIRGERESAIARARDIAIGDAVRTHDVNFGRRMRLLVKVGPKRITLGVGHRAECYDREHGCVIDNYGCSTIHPDDLARINRCFPRGSTTKKAPRLG